MIAGQAWWSELRSTVITEKPGVIEYTCKYNLGGGEEKMAPVLPCDMHIAPSAPHLFS